MTLPAPLAVPNSCEAEEGVIGSLLINGGCFPEVAAVLQADDFYIHRHRWIFEACATLTARNLPLDILTISDALGRVGQLSDIGGDAYLMTLVNNVPNSMNVLGYASIVKETAIRRKMLTAASAIARLAYDESRSVDDVVAESEKQVVSVSCSLTGDRRREMTASQAAAAHYEQTLTARDRHGDDGRPGSGLPDVERITGNWQRGDLAIIAGDPGSGKSSFLQTILAHISKTHSAALFSLEMSTSQVMTRLACIIGNLDVFRVRRGELSPGEWMAYAQAIEQIEHSPILFNDTCAITPTRMHAACTRYAARQPLDVIMVDYIQIMGVEGINKTRNREQEVGEFARSLKRLAREFDTTVIAAAQLNRARHSRADKRPILADLRDSGALESEADMVMFLWSEKPPDPADFSVDLVPIDLYVAKHRNGPVGEATLLFDKPSTKFVSATTRTVDLNADQYPPHVYPRSED